MSYTKSDKLHIVAVTATIRRSDGRYLIVKRADHEIAHPGMWAFPGGKVEGRESIEEALRKEVQEEVGLKALPGKVLLKDAAFTRPDGQTVKVLSFLVEVESDDVQLDTRDFSDYRWVTAEELGDLNHVGIAEEIRQAEAFLAAANGKIADFQTKSQRDD